MLGISVWTASMTRYVGALFHWYTTYDMILKVENLWYDSYVAAYVAFRRVALHTQVPVARLGGMFLVQTA